jgi:competence protein ComEC
MGRAHALAAGVLVVALASTADTRLGILIAAAVLAAAVLGPRRVLPGRGVRLALAVGAILLAARLALGAPGNADAQLEGGSIADGSSGGSATSPARGTVESVIRRAGGKQSAVLDIAERGLGSGSVYAQLPRYPEVSPGDFVTVEGRLEALPADPPPDDAGWVGYLRRIGVGATIQASTVRLDGASDDPASWLARLRSGLGDMLGAALPEPLAGLASAILIGLRERVDPTLVREFTASGLTHVVAISGWNIAIVGATCGALTRRLSRRRRSIVIGAVIVAYTLVAGASPSVVRAALMAAVALLARESGRRAGASRALALAIVVMVVEDPATVVDPGFQLSSCATAGLVAWATPLGERLARRTPRVPGLIRESLAVSLSAQLATLPVVLLDFGRLSLVSPAANLVAAPLVPLVMAGAAIALPLGALIDAGVPAVIVSIPLALATLPLALLVAIVHAAASVPYASVELSPSLAGPAAAVAAAVVFIVARSTVRIASGAGGARLRPGAATAVR